MRSTLNTAFALVAAAALSLGGLSELNAATVEVSGVGGSWTALVPPTGPTGVNGIGTNSVRWGTPFGRSRQQSGYSFVGAASGKLETGVDFDLGTFTHNNFVIKTGTSISGAGLSIAVNLMIGGASRAINTAFNFAHWETVNNGEGNGRCANGGSNRSGVNSSGCADRVSILDNKASDQSFEIDGFLYILEITGFSQAGALFTEFWTQENAANSAILRAKFTLVGAVDPVGRPPSPVPLPAAGTLDGAVDPVDPLPSPVPLPAAGWMVLTGLAALAAARARRRKS